MSNLTEINESDFESFIKEPVVLVDFWASWCGPCKVLGPILDQLAGEMTNVKFAKVDVENNMNLASKYNIRSVPTMLIFVEGELKDRIMGSVNKDIISKKLGAWL